MAADRICSLSKKHNRVLLLQTDFQQTQLHKIRNHVRQTSTLWKLKKTTQLLEHI